MPSLYRSCSFYIRQVEFDALSNRLIRIIPGNIQENGRGEAVVIEAAFRIPGNTHLRLKVHDWGGKAAEYLDHAVVRAPHDLRGHVQRINLHIQRNDAEAVYGALLDLFIILKTLGRPLRDRMLKQSQAVLSEEVYQFLVQRLEVGIVATDVVLPSRTSLLSKGFSGTNRLVIKLDTSEAPTQDPLEEALDRLEYGQIDEAKQVLEAAILKEPGRPELLHDLLEIYKSTNARESFLAMRQRLSTNANPAADAWRELAAFLGEES